MPRNEPPIEIWGGIECSHVLINGEIRDQLHETGHHQRLRDLDLIAELGVKTLRYPVLWGREAAPAWQDARMARLAELGIDLIAGFLHHGSGPDGLHPLEPGFKEALADHAEAVVLRYPWLRRFTPINEPVTTARFSYLYGHWHPHLRDEDAFLRAVTASAVATALAMARIRRHIPEAELIQTEDLGRVFAPPALACQADYENDRRFLGMDLLTGRVSSDHPFHRRLLQAGVDPRDLDRLEADPCPPQVIGIDQYLTSDRYLDPDLERHPPSHHGGNGRDTYADVAAVHLHELHDQVGFLPRLREVYARYDLPIALTEVHNGARPEGQLRWLDEAWRAACAARAEGIALRAITPWSLFGCMDWDSLLCERRGRYEPGAFDIRFDPPRRTVLGHAIARLARASILDHPILAQSDWWRPFCPSQPVLLSVQGAPEWTERFVRLCAQRHIRATTAGPPPRMGRVIIDSDASGLSLRGLTPEGLLILDHRADAAAGPDDSMHLFLDLLIEGVWSDDNSISKRSRISA
ncbi:hypothetical protein [Paracoccus sp. (in: a-proteobacteria)]|uniref:hypothetical protein n=1 Tax=Paracoccus sp. TaxID=267 RepID=UPI00396C9298